MFERIKKVFQPQQETTKPSATSQVKDVIQGLKSYRMSYKLANDIMSDQKLSTHQEKAKCKKAYRSNAYLQTQVNSLVNKILGENPGISSENEIIRDYGQKWLKFSNFKRAKKEALIQGLVTGDGYIKKLKGSKGSIKYENIENSEDIYIDYDWKNNKVRQYIQRVYYTEAQMKKFDRVQTFRIPTPWGVETINGISHSPDEIVHFKFLDDHYGLYGRSPIASVLDDIQIMQRMERSIAVISTFKAIPKKILMPKPKSDSQGMDSSTMSQNEVDKISQTLNQLSDSESPVVGKALESLNLTDTNAIDLNGYLDKLKRKIAIVLTPQFIIHGDMQNRSTSDSQDREFLLDLQGIRDEFIDEINEAVKEGMNASLRVLRKQNVQVPNAFFEYQFGDFQVETREQKQERLLREWNDGMITLNEYRRENGYPEDEQLGDLYKFELTNSQQQQAVETMKKLFSQDEKLNEKLPEPNPNEKKDDFINRCMSDSQMKKEFPENDQRLAVCNKQWKK